MPIREAIWGSASVLSLAIRTRGSRRAAACSYAGAIILHGPHQDLAWPTPRGPKVDDYRDIICNDMAIEVCLRKLNRASGKLRLLALAAFRVVHQATARHTICRVAMRAHDVQNVSHRSTFQNASRSLRSCGPRVFPAAVIIKNSSFTVRVGSNDHVFNSATACSRFDPARARVTLSRLATKRNATARTNMARFLLGSRLTRGKYPSSTPLAS